MEYEKYTMYYDIQTSNDFIRILGEEFIRNNKNKGRIIYKNKKYSLLGLFEIKNIMKDILTIEMILSKDSYNKSCMFKECSSLLYINNDNNIYNKEDIIFNKINNLCLENNKDNHNYDNYKWNTKISSIDEIFSNCSSLLALPDISEWNTNNIIEYYKIFYNCRSLLYLPDISKWDTKKAICTNRMFDNCSSLALLSASEWDNNNSLKISQTFYSYLKLYMLNYKFNLKNHLNKLKIIVKLLESLPSSSYKSKNRKNNMNISYMLEKSSTIFKLIYDIKKEEDEIKIFDKIFVNNNKIKCKTIINNKIHLLTDKYQISDNEIKQLKIKLVILNNKGMNLNHMFYDCKSLKNFSALSQEEIKPEIAFKEENKNNQIKIINSSYSNEFYDKKNHKFDNYKTIYSISNEVNNTKRVDKSYINRNKLHILLCKSYKKDISDYDEQKMQEIFDNSHCFLFKSSLFDSNKFQNDCNIKEENLINADSFFSTITTIVKKDSKTIKNKDFYEYFYSLKFTSYDIFGVENIVANDLSYMFYGCSSLIYISGISNWNTDNVISMAHLFEKCSKLKNIIDISQWNINKVNNISYMFSGCSSLESVPDISNWNTNSVKNMREIFSNCSALKSLPDISKWNTQNIHDMSFAFFNCTSLSSLPDISKWNTQNVNNMLGIFSACSSLLSLPDISKWNTCNVINLGGIFINCLSLKSIPDISKWNTNKIENLDKIFCGCSFISSLPDISNWKTDNVTKMDEMFYNCSSLLTLPDLSKWETCKINNINCIFAGCTLLKNLPDISQWDTKNVTNMNAVFMNCSSLKSLPDISKWNIENVTDLSFIFGKCLNLLSLPDISKWNTKNVINMNGIFSCCTSLVSLPDISYWETNKVINMAELFCKCSLLVSLPDISKWNTNNVTYMNGIFGGCKSLLSLPDISIWNVNKVKDLSEIFVYCSSLVSLPDISKWNFDEAIDLNFAFYNCLSLISLPNISKWNTKNVTNVSMIFSECISLISLPDISKWNSENLKDMISPFSNCLSMISLPDISKWNNYNEEEMNLEFDYGTLKSYINFNYEYFISKISPGDNILNNSELIGDQKLEKWKMIYAN